MTILYSDVIRHEDSSSNLLASTRPGQTTYETDGNRRQMHQTTDGGVNYWTPDDKFTGEIPSYTNITYPAVTNVTEALDSIISDSSNFGNTVFTEDSTFIAPIAVTPSFLWNTVDEALYCGLTALGDHYVQVSAGVGQSGFSGYSGFSGAVGGTGATGPIGPQGTSGFSGYSGFSGISGINGAAAASGYSGFSGQNPGASGFSGYSGADGSNGSSGYSGYSGSNGSSGYSGYSGSNGSSGYSGLNGSSGYSGATPANYKVFRTSNITSSPIWRCPVNITITAVHYLLLASGGTSLVGSLWEFDSNGLNGAKSHNDSTISNYTNVDVTSFTDANIAAGNYIGWHQTSGTPTGVVGMDISIEYTIA